MNNCLTTWRNVSTSGLVCSTYWKFIKFNKFIEFIKIAVFHKTQHVSSVPLSICNVTSLKDYILLKQVHCDIFRDLIDSFRLTLYRGLQPVLTSLYCSNFVYFYTFNGMKAIATSKGVNATPTRDLIFGYLSGIALLLILPFLFLKISNIGTIAKSMVIVLLPLWLGTGVCVTPSFQEVVLK